MEEWCGRAAGIKRGAKCADAGSKQRVPKNTPDASPRIMLSEDFMIRRIVPPEDFPTRWTVPSEDFLVRWIDPPEGFPIRGYD